LFLAKPTLSTGEIVGIAIGGVAAIVIIIALIYCLYRNLKKPKETQGKFIINSIYIKNTFNLIKNPL
jgi:predicted permease